MRRYVGRYMLMVLGGLALLAAFMPAEPAYAQAVPDTVSECTDYAGLTHRIAGCIRDSIDQGAEVFFKRVYPYLQTGIGAVMTIAVLVYGVLLSFGMIEKVGRDTFVLLLKLAAVILFCSSSPLIMTTVVNIMDKAALAVVTYTPPSGVADNAGSDFSQTECMQNMIEEQEKADPDKPVIAPWLGVDCLVDTVIGIHVDMDPPPTTDGKWFNDKLEGVGKQGMSRGLLFFFFSGIQTSILGMIIAFIGFFFIFGLLMLIVRAFFTYIAGYMGVTFLVIISPLIIPMVLFKETKPYFEKWAKMLISFALQPIIMLVFIIFSLTAMDLAVFSGDYSIMYRIAGDESRKSDFQLNDFLTVPRQKDGTPLAPTDPKAVPKTYPACADCAPIILKAPKTVAQVKADSPFPMPPRTKDEGGALHNQGYIDCSEKAMKADPERKKLCGYNYPMAWFLTSIDWEKLEKARTPKVTPVAGKPGQAISREVLSAIFFTCVVVFILNGVLAIVPAIAQDLLGDYLQSPGIGGLHHGGLGKGKGGNNQSTSSMASSSIAGKLGLGR